MKFITTEDIEVSVGKYASDHKSHVDHEILGLFVSDRQFDGFGEELFLAAEDLTKIELVNSRLITPAEAFLMITPYIDFDQLGALYRETYENIKMHVCEYILEDKCGPTLFNLFSKPDKQIAGITPLDYKKTDTVITMTNQTPVIICKKNDFTNVHIEYYRYAIKRYFSAMAIGILL